MCTCFRRKTSSVLKVKNKDPNFRKNENNKGLKQTNKQMNMGIHGY